MNQDSSTCTCITDTERHVICDDCRKLEKESLLDFLDIDVATSSLHEIIDNLYLGDRHAASNKDILGKYKISHILVAGESLKISFPDEYVYKSFSLINSQHQDIKQYFEEAIKFIHAARKERKAILVHCSRGASRSATLVIAYLMMLNSWTFKDALTFVKSKRSIVNPFFSFKAQLEMFEKEIPEKNLIWIE